MEAKVGPCYSLMIGQEKQRQAKQKQKKTNPVKLNHHIHFEILPSDCVGRSKAWALEPDSEFKFWLPISSHEILNM